MGSCRGGGGGAVSFEGPLVLLMECLDGGNWGCNLHLASGPSAHVGL